MNYKNVMKQYNLGPNGGILTSLNLFATRFDQVRFLLLMHAPRSCWRHSAYVQSRFSGETVLSLHKQHGCLRAAWSQVCAGLSALLFITMVLACVRASTGKHPFVFSLAHQVIQLCEKRRDPPVRYIVADTPGQIEIFTWSASGAIITEAFASSFPTVIAFVVDTPRAASPQTFMSNMLQAR